MAGVLFFMGSEPSFTLASPPESDAGHLQQL
jgi:hypothetical protein